MNHKDVFTLDVNSWMDFENLYDHIAKQKSGLTVEVGSWQGSSACYMALKLKEYNKLGINSPNLTKFYCIDTFSGIPNDTQPDQRVIAIDGIPIKEIFIKNAKTLGLSVFEHPLSRIRYIQDLADIFTEIQILHTDSITGLNLFDDKSVDFIFLDGEHNYATVVKEIELAKLKIKDDGWIGGHDWTDGGVQAAVRNTLGNVEEWISTRDNVTRASWLWRQNG